MAKFIIDDSPFKFKRNYNAKNISKSFRLPEDVYNEIMRHYDSIYGGENNIAKAFRDITLEKLDNICRERKSFQELNILMVIPKTDDINELNEKSEIIGFFSPDDFKDINHKILMRDEGDENPMMIKHNLTSHRSNEEYYEFIKYINPKCFNFNMKEVSSFKEFETKLNETYPQIDLSDSYIVGLEVNNYFDIYRDGEFQSDILNNTHVGAYVFVDYSLNYEGKTINRKLYCIVQWNYRFNVLNIDFEFCSYDKLMLYFKKDEINDNESIKKVIRNIYFDEDRKEALINSKKEITLLIERLNKNLDRVNDMLKKDFPDVFEN